MKTWEKVKEEEEKETRSNPLTTHPNRPAPRLSSKVAVSYALYPRYEQFPSACWLARARRCRIKGDRRKKVDDVLLERRCRMPHRRSEAGRSRSEKDKGQDGGVR